MRVIKKLAEWESTQKAAAILCYDPRSPHEHGYSEHYDPHFEPLVAGRDKIPFHTPQKDIYGGDMHLGLDRDALFIHQSLLPAPATSADEVAQKVGSMSFEPTFEGEGSSRPRKDKGRSKEDKGIEEKPRNIEGEREKRHRSHYHKHRHGHGHGPR